MNLFPSMDSTTASKAERRLFLKSRRTSESISHVSMPEPKGRRRSGACRAMVARSMSRSSRAVRHHSGRAAVRSSRGPDRTRVTDPSAAERGAAAGSRMGKKDGRFVLTTVFPCSTRTVDRWYGRSSGYPRSAAKRSWIQTVASVSASILPHAEGRVTAVVSPSVHRYSAYRSASARRPARGPRPARDSPPRNSPAKYRRSVWSGRRIELPHDNARSLAWRYGWARGAPGRGDREGPARRYGGHAGVGANRGGGSPARRRGRRAG